MNQETVIYIILSAILLYLYYRKKDIAIFVAFVIVAGGTLIFRGSMSCEGFVEGNTSSKKGEGCSKLGFTEPNITKNKWKASLVKSLKNIEEVADKYWKFEDMIGNKPKNDSAKQIYTKVTENDFFKKESETLNKDKNKQETAMKFLGGAVGMYDVLVKNSGDKEKEKKLWGEITSDSVNKAIEGGDMYITLMKKNHDNLKKDDADKDVLALSRYLLCLARQWQKIFKQLKPVIGSDGDE